MPRKKRVWYPGATYHIVSRGNRKSHLFRDQLDFEFYLDILRKIKAKCGFSLPNLAEKASLMLMGGDESAILIFSQAENKNFV